MLTHQHYHALCKYSERETKRERNRLRVYGTSDKKLPSRWTLRRTLKLLQPTEMVVRRSKLYPNSTFTMRTSAVACNCLSSSAAQYFRNSRNFNTTIIGNIYLGNLRHLGPVYCNSIAYRADGRTKKAKFPSLRVWVDSPAALACLIKFYEDFFLLFFLTRRISCFDICARIYV